MKKILLFFIMLGFFITNTYAENLAFLSVDKTNILINDTLKLKVVIDFAGDDISFKDVDLHGNFETISTSSFTNSSSEINIVNGQAKQISKNEMTILLELKPLKTGNFETGPAVFLSNGNEIKSNTVKVNIEKGSIFSNDEQNISNNNGNEKSIIEIISYIILVGLLVLGLNYAVILRLKNKKEFEKVDFGNDFGEKIIFYPEIDDEYFEIKLNNIFLDYLEEKYNISNIYSKTSKEILEEINIENKVEIEDVLNKFDMLKYSNTKEGKENLLEKVKNLTFLRNN